MENNNYKNFRVWQKSMDLVFDIYTLVKKLPREETYCLSDQMRRAAISIPSNISEGFGRHTNKDFIKFLAVSRGSLYELGTQLEICGRIGYFEYSEIELIFKNIEEIGKMINGLIGYRNSLERNDEPRALNPKHLTPNTEHLTPNTEL